MASKKPNSPPWEQENPKGAGKRPMTEAQKAFARASAKKAGRRYPNLIDNMLAKKALP